MLFVNVQKNYMVNIEIVYCPSVQLVIHVSMKLEVGTTVKEAIRLSGLLNEYPEILDLSIGVFSRLVSLSKPIQAGDRLEIYRSLLVDPKERRRARAKDS